MIIIPLGGLTVLLFIIAYVYVDFALNGLLVLSLALWFAAMVAVVASLGSPDGVQMGLSPSYLIGAVLLAILAWLVGGARNDVKTTRARQLAAQFKACPACAEVVKVQAAVCKHCGHQFSNPEAS
jgi:hypothetical protein